MRTTDQPGGATRRALLRAGAGAALATAAGLGPAGCGLFSGDPEPPPRPDPLAPLLAGTLRLIARYDDALTAHADLGATLAPVRAAHAAHAVELGRLLGSPSATASPDGSASPTVAPTDARATLAALRAAEQEARREAADACLSAPAERAALLGSIAAARACHAEVLR